MKGGTLLISCCFLLTQLSLHLCNDQIINVLLRQAIAQQDYAEEMARMDGASGVRGTRYSQGGTKNYFYPSHVGRRMIAMHNHANLKDTIGMGELDVVLNGVQFRTRHNDYKLVMPHSTSSNLKDSEAIPFPDVPPEVLQYTKVSDQIKEMREFFKAFKQQDTKIRDYKKYFKPVLCYMEGAWMTSSKELDEPFDSDRHFIDAKDWHDLQEKVAFTSYTGSKSEDENYAYLPTRITELLNETTPVIAQWNYRIRCAPVALESDQGIDLKRFRFVDDLSAQLMLDKTAAEISQTRAARFSLDYWPTNKPEGKKWERDYHLGILDELMYQIPGYDNYQGYVEDNAFDSLALTFDGKTLDSSRYHRRFKKAKKDAMGSSARRRGFADPNLFMSQNTKSNVPGAKYEKCEKRNGVETCTSFRQRWSWAIPLEIIYLTPLLSWNPYKLHYHSKADKGKVTQGGRNGELTADKAYNGIAHNSYFMTPKEFFEDDIQSDDADTGNDAVGVLDPNGEVRQVRSSGTRVFIPEIQDVGTFRTRYPIVPIYNDGNQMSKELEALKDIVLRMQQYSSFLKEAPVSGGGNIGGGNGDGGNGGDQPTTPRPDIPDSIELAVGETTKNPPGIHTHLFTLTSTDIEKLMQRRGTVTVETSQGAGHTHSLQLKIVRNRLKIFRCDGKARCWDRHPAFVKDADEFIRKIKNLRKRG